jgi:IS5 family transposase
VIQAPLDHPTDFGLLADGVRLITRWVKGLQAAGVATRTAFRDRRRTVNGALRPVSRILRQRTGEAQGAVERYTARVVSITRHVIRQAQRVLSNTRRAVQR